MESINTSLSNLKIDEKYSKEEMKRLEGMIGVINVNSLPDVEKTF